MADSTIESRSGWVTGVVFLVALQGALYRSLLPFYRAHGQLAARTALGCALLVVLVGVAYVRARREVKLRSERWRSVGIARLGAGIVALLTYVYL